MSRPELKNYVPTNLSPLPHETVSILLSTDRRDLERVMVDDLIEINRTGSVSNVIY